MRAFMVMSFATATLIACMAFALAKPPCNAESGPPYDGPLA